MVVFDADGSRATHTERRTRLIALALSAIDAVFVGVAVWLALAPVNSVDTQPRQCSALLDNAVACDSGTTALAWAALAALAAGLIGYAVATLVVSRAATSREGSST